MVAQRTDVRTLQIGSIVDGPVKGGGERYYFDLLKSLPSQGVGVRGLVLGTPPGGADFVPGVESFAPTGVSAVQRVRDLRRGVGRLLPASDLVVSHLALHTFPVLDQIRSHPLVVHFHFPIALGERIEGTKGWKFGVHWLREFAVYRRARLLIVLSNAFARILERSYRIPPAAIRVIPGGVDIGRFAVAESRAEARAQLGLPSDRPIVVAARRLVRAKGLENLVGAVEIVRRSVPDVLLVLAGDGPLAEPLQRQVADAGLERNVRFLGHVGAALPMLYRAADLSIVPSVAWEGFGLVVIESLACGTPVLVTPNEGLPEVVADLDPGLVLPGFTSEQLASGLRDAIAGRLPLPDERACRAYATRFDWTTIATRIRHAYLEAA